MTKERLWCERCAGFDDLILLFLPQKSRRIKKEKSDWMLVGNGGAPAYFAAVDCDFFSIPPRHTLGAVTVLVIRGLTG
jgi:hypothetical protein